MHLGQTRRIWLYKRVDALEYITRGNSQPRVDYLVTTGKGIEGSKTVRTQMAYAKALIHPTGRENGCRGKPRTASSSYRAFSPSLNMYLMAGL